MADLLLMSVPETGHTLIQYQVHIQVTVDDGPVSDGAGLETATVTSGGPRPPARASLLSCRILNACQRDTEHPFVSRPPLIFVYIPVYISHDTLAFFVRNDSFTMAPTWLGPCIRCGPKRAAYGHILCRAVT
jgi:hypothetical protein